jgi:hypothetical protein
MSRSHVRALAIASTGAVGLLVFAGGSWTSVRRDRTTSDFYVQARGSVVSARAVGPVPFGSSRAKVRAWIGGPGFSSPPDRAGKYHDQQAVVVWGWHCATVDGSVCHMLLGFRAGKLTSFLSGPTTAFRFRSGVQPGMTIAEARRREPGSTLIDGSPACSKLVFPSPKGTSRLAVIVDPASHSKPKYVYSLYASSGDAAFGPHC